MKREVKARAATVASADRLEAMILALASGDEISAPLRAEILSTLKSLEVVLVDDEARRHKRRGVALHTFQAAALARELIDNHDVKPKKNATRAAFESVRDRLGLTAELTYESVERAYRKIKDSPDCSMRTPKGDKIVLALISDGFIEDALSRLPGPNKAHHLRAAKPPFVIVLAHLSRPEKSGNK